MKFFQVLNLHHSIWRSLIQGAIGTAIALCPMRPAASLTVSPSGVNINTFGATTVFLTYISLNGFRPVEAIWCGDIKADQSCVAGTVYGRLPKRSDRGRLSGSSNLSSGNNSTDLMTIPPSVARKAYQDAVKGASSEFFYVRRFVSDAGLPDVFVAVTCRLAGGGARVPLALTNVRLRFDRPNPNQAIPVIPPDQPMPKFQAELTYNGTGRLKGRWEVVLPGDPPPTEDDRLPEASLPIERRALQQHYTVIDRFDTYLMPTGRVVIPGPNPRRVPRGTDGLHQILFRVEATDEREGLSETGLGTVSSGGVAGFPLPVLRYYVGRTQASNTLNLLQPGPGETMNAGAVVKFRWEAVANTAVYRLEVFAAQTLVVSALLNGNTIAYTAPPWLKDQAGQTLRWQVKALDRDGKPILESAPQEFSIQTQN
jgi:hypothetical protein